MFSPEGTWLTAQSVIRQGDVDWLSSFQIGKVLLGKVLKADSHAKKREIPHGIPYHPIRVTSHAYSLIQ